MKYFRQASLLILILLACATVAFSQTEKPATPEPPAPESKAESWKEFSSTAGRFKIQFPGAPAEKTQPIEGGEIHIVALRTFAEYSVMYADYPVPVEGAEAARSVLDNGAKGAVASLNAELLELKEITLEGHPGRLLKAKLPDGKILRANMYLVGQRLYQVAITTPAEQGKAAETVRLYDSVASKYLDSFKPVPASR